MRVRGQRSCKVDHFFQRFRVEEETRNQLKLVCLTVNRTPEMLEKETVVSEFKGVDSVALLPEDPSSENVPRASVNSCTLCKLSMRQEI